MINRGDIKLAIDMVVNAQDDNLFGGEAEYVINTLEDCGNTIAAQAGEITKLREQVAAQAAVIESLRRHAENYKILCQDAGHPWHYLDAREALSIPTDSTQILDKVRRAERERCAKVCDEYLRDGGKGYAAAIRAME